MTAQVLAFALTEGDARRKAAEKYQPLFARNDSGVRACEMDVHLGDQIDITRRALRATAVLIKATQNPALRAKYETLRSRAFGYYITTLELRGSFKDGQAARQSFAWIRLRAAAEEVFPEICPR